HEANRTRKYPPTPSSLPRGATELAHHRLLLVESVASALALTANQFFSCATPEKIPIAFPKRQEQTGSPCPPTWRPPRVRRHLRTVPDGAPLRVGVSWSRIACLQGLRRRLGVVAKPVRLCTKTVQQRLDRAPVCADGHLGCELPDI